jgi:DNA-binding NarL/FixJ family response regulator
MNLRPPIRLVIADDHALFRQGLRSLLRLHPEIDLIGEISNTMELQSVVAAMMPDMLLLDLQMERWSMDHIPQLARMTKVIVLTASENIEIGMRALRLGARAIVQKRFAIETLVTAIQTVAEGHVWMPPSLQTEFADQQISPTTKLTAREAEIVRCVAAGLRNAQIAQDLSITESTVKSHLNNIFQKLGVRDRLGLMHYALKSGLVSIP